MGCKLNEEKAALVRKVVAKLIEEYCDHPPKDAESVLALEVNVILESEDRVGRCGFSVGPYEVMKAKLDYEDKVAELVDDALAISEKTKELPDFAKEVLKKKLRKCLFD